MIIFISLAGVTITPPVIFGQEKWRNNFLFLQAEAASPTSLFVFGGANDDTGTMNAGVASVANSDEAVSPAFQKNV